MSANTTRWSATSRPASRQVATYRLPHQMKSVSLERIEAVMGPIPGGAAAKAFYVREHHVSIIEALRQCYACAARAGLESDVSAASELDGLLPSSDTLECTANEPSAKSCWRPLRIPRRVAV